jgi:formate/nitrite transporter FocA (FNT family)
MTKRSPFLVLFLAFVGALFIGILIFVYFVTKQTNPVMLDDHGRPQPTAVLWLPSA